MTWNNLVLLTAWGLMAWAVGPLLFFACYTVAGSLAGGYGLILFTVQHNFEHAYASADEGWDRDEAALHGTSFLILPSWLNWITADAAYHHVHHLCAGVPNYRLAACHKEHEALFSSVRRVGLFEIPAPSSTSCGTSRRAGSCRWRRSWPGARPDIPGRAAREARLCQHGDSPVLPRNVPMPLARIDLPAGKSDAFRRAVGDVIYDAMTATLNVPANDRFQIFHEHAEGTLVMDPTYLGISRSGDALVLQVTLNEGRSLEMKRAFYKAVADGLHERVGLRREDVMITLVEVRKENWSFGNGEAQYAT